MRGDFVEKVSSATVIPDKPILVISDLQFPYENKNALQFCYGLKQKFNIPDENILNVGDEIDNFHGSAYPKDPDAPDSAINEFALVRTKIDMWKRKFPLMKIAISNHGIRWIKKAADAQIPSHVLKAYNEIFKLPDGWVHRDEWRFSTGLKMPFRMVHGMGYSGILGHRNATLDGQISTIIGHLHSHAGVNWIQTNGGSRMWSVNAGSLIDVDAFAFKYERYNRIKPQLGAVVIFDYGRCPVFFPL
jgi:hypothetical protein